MFGWGRTGTVHAPAPVSPARSQEIYQRYAVALYRQALLNLDDPASAGQVAGDPVVNECALAAMAQQDRRSGQRALGFLLSGGLGCIRVKQGRRQR